MVVANLLYRKNTIRAEDCWWAWNDSQWSGVCPVTSSTAADHRCHVQECARCWRPLLRAPGRHIQPLHFQEKWEGRQRREERREKWRHRIHHQAGETSMMGPSFWGARVLVHYSFKIWILIDCLNLIFIFIIIVNVKISTYKSSKQDHCLYMLNHHSSRF